MSELGEALKCEEQVCRQAELPRFDDVMMLFYPPAMATKRSMATSAHAAPASILPAAGAHENKACRDVHPLVWILRLKAGVGV